jgi:integrase
MATVKANRFNFTKRSIDALPEVPKGQRRIYHDTAQNNLCLRATATGKTFFFQRKFRGRQVNIGIGRYPDLTPTQAREKAQEYAGDYAKGHDVAANMATQRSELTFGELFADYLVNRKKARPGQKSKSLQQHWSAYLNKWENRRLSNLTQPEVRRMILKLRKTAPYAANRVQRTGKAAYNHAITELKWVGDNPFDFSQVNEDGRERERRVSPAELGRLFAAFDKLTGDTADLFRLAVFTGQRAGNIKTMKFTDADLETGVWRIPTTKQGKVHEAVLPAVAIELLANRRHKIRSPYVFPGRKSGEPLASYQMGWKNVLKLSGIKNLRVHDLRHVSASLMAEANVNTALIQAQLGHSTATMTSRYIHGGISPRRLALDAALASAGLTK